MRELQSKISWHVIFTAHGVVTHTYIATYITLTDNGTLATRIQMNR